VVGDPVGVGELLVGVGEGLGVRDGLGDCVGRGEVWAGLDGGAAGEEGLVVDWLEPADAAVGTGRTRM
jgi:hypothetical protein